ncbi:hypothetical protein [Agilicoccus flavus]|uniref:hypothetical protein n=1 Tax=Agilicoccus flavus TaxID=2775968 RepID=UPI001CF6D233|nr:hypothetical protein [Agilicoccus flavus]
MRDQRRQACTWAEGPGPAPTVQVVRGRHMIMLQWPAVLAGALLELAADAAPTPAP